MGSFSPIAFIQARLRIAKENPLFWYNVLLIGATAIAVWLWPAPIIDNTPSDFRIRLWGMALQIIGALTVWHDLTESARKFGRPGFVANTKAWIKRLVSADAIAIGSVSLPLQITVIGGSAKSRRDSPPAGAPIEERVAALEYNLVQIDSEIGRESKRVTDVEISLTDKIQKETTLRESALNNLHQNLQEAIVGNYAYLVFGAFWVVVGIIISALAPEIAKTMAGQWALVWKGI